MGWLGEQWIDCALTATKEGLIFQFDPAVQALVGKKDALGRRLPDEATAA